MSILESNKIDAASIDDSSSRLKLTISDHLTWNDECEHLTILQSKINCYVQYVESGQVWEDYHKDLLKHGSVIVNIVLKYPPPRAAREFLVKVNEIISPLAMVAEFSQIE